jgi:hypothetical protein
LIVTPTIEKIVHTAKHTVKAIVDIESARVADASGLGTIGLGAVGRGSLISGSMIGWEDAFRC